MKKTFDAVAFMRKRREELSRVYANLSAEEIEARVQEALKDNPLWKRQSEKQRPLPAKTRARSSIPREK
jgi:hypothetical protein